MIDRITKKTGERGSSECQCGLTQKDLWTSFLGMMMGVGLGLVIGVVGALVEHSQVGGDIIVSGIIALAVLVIVVCALSFQLAMKKNGYKRAGFNR